MFTPSNRTLILLSAAVLCLSAATHVFTQRAELIADVETGQIEETMVVDEAGDDGADAAEGARRGVKPLRIRQEQREQLERESDIREQIGEEINRMQESQKDLTSTERLSFDELKSIALEKLSIASESLEQDGAHGTEISTDHASPPADDHSRGEWQHAAAPAEQPHLVCFRIDGSVTGNREECAVDQSGFFGMPSEEEGHGMDEFSYDLPSEDDMASQMSQRFPAHEQGVPGGNQMSGGGDLLQIISEAFERLSGMVTAMQGNPSALGEIQQTMSWLGSLMRQYGSGQMPPGQSEIIAGQVRERLSAIASMQSERSMGGHAGAAGGFGGPDISAILAMMEKMMTVKIPHVFQIFADAGIAVPPEAMEAYRRGLALFQEVKGPCGNGDYQACARMEEVGMIMENGMRPAMEVAIMTSGKWDIGMKIGAYMSEGMEGMMPHRGGMSPNGSMHGSPDSMMHGEYGGYGQYGGQQQYGEW